jgi:hypothetical protein
MTKRPDPRVVAGETAESLRRLLRAVEQGELTAGSARAVALVRRLEGAAVERGQRSGLRLSPGTSRRKPSDRLKYERRKGSTTVYRCVTKRSTAHGCAQAVSITAAPLEDYVTKALLMSHARFDRQQKTAIERGATVRQRHAARLGEIQRTLDQLTSRLGEADGLVLDEYERQVSRLVSERATIEEVIAEIEAETANVRELPTEQTWATMSHESRREAIRGLVRRIVISRGMRPPGGKPDRGVDLEGRVRFEMTFDDHPARSAMGRVFYGAIDWSEAPSESGAGLSVTLNAELADEVESSLFVRTDLLIEEDPAESRRGLSEKVAELNIGTVRQRSPRTHG